jgi:hypothetical protein
VVIQPQRNNADDVIIGVWRRYNEERRIGGSLFTVKPFLKNVVL